MKLVICNVPTEQARQIAKHLVDSRVAGCVNILPPAASVYRWDNEVVEESESPLLIKTTTDGLPRLRDVLLEIHPYDVPEIIALNLDEAGSHAPYLKWLSDNVVA